MEAFTIDFTYDGTIYTALVTPHLDGGTTTYSVQLESENQENFVEILATPPTSGVDHWAFTCADGQEPPGTYDKKLLEEIGEAIEKNEINGGNQQIPLE